MKRVQIWIVFAVAAMIAGPLRAQLPPNRSTHYDGSAGVQMRFPAAIYAPTLDLTVEAWVYREDASRCETIVSQDFTKSFWLGFCNNSLRFYRNGGQFADADRNVPARRWTHVAATYNGFSQQTRFYIDGTLVTTKAIAATNAPVNLPLYLGMTPASLFLGTTYPFKGALDEVRIWSRALTTAELGANRFREVTEGDGLVAVFPRGGFTEVAGSRTANATNGVTAQVFGILPRDLIIPRRPLFDPVDGDITNVEYAGAEQIAMRYLRGTNEVDFPAYLNGYVAAGVTYVYVGISGSSWETDLASQGASFNWYYGLGEEDHAYPDVTDHKATTFFNAATNVFYRGDGVGTFVIDSAPTTRIIKAFCSGDVNPPCLEMRDAITIGSPRALMLDLLIPGKFLSPAKRFTAPLDAIPTDPRTWAKFGMGSTIGAAETVRVNATVRDLRLPGAAPAPLGGVLVRLMNASSLDEIRSATTRPDGTVSFEVNIRTNTPLLVELSAPGYWPRLGARGVPGTGVLPASTTSGSVRFAPCTGCDFADIEFDTRFVPEASIATTSLSPTFGHFKRTVIRESPLRELPPSQIVIAGDNFHGQTKLYLTTCDRVVFNIAATTPDGATGCLPSSFYEISISDISADRHALTATLDAVAAPIGSSLRLLLYDMASRGAERRWQFVPGSVTLGQPPFPLSHGFKFHNERDGTQFDEFSGVFEWHAYDCVVPPGIIIPPVQDCPGCRIPDPVYTTYYAVFTAWVEAMTGSCLGMAATSLLFARGTLDTEAFDRNVHYAHGFLGVPVPGDDPAPPKPQIHDFRECNYSVPVNLWANIHRNQAVQATHEFLTSILSQMYGTGIGTDSYSINGNPGLTLQRLRTGLGSSILCFQNLGNVFESHATVPYAITEGKALSTNGFDLVDAPDSTIIHLYDSNWPGRTDRFLEVNRASNRFKYMFGYKRVVNPGVSTNIVEDFWNGSGLYVVPISLWTQPRSMPGIDLLSRGLTLIFFGNADGLYMDRDGGQWGWDQAGAFHDTYLGGKAFAPMTSSFPSANTSRGIFFFPPTNRPPSAVQANIRGGPWLFHAAEAGTLCQLEVPAGTANDTDTIQLSTRDGILNGFRFSPRRRATGFVPRLGLNLGMNPSAVFSWEGVGIGAGKSVEFTARPEISGVEMHNDSGETSTIALRVVRADTDRLKTNSFGPFQVPAGATHLASLPRLDGSALRTEVDLDRDGTSETVAFILPSDSSTSTPPTLEAHANSEGLVIQWPVNGGAWSLEQTLSLGTGNWTSVGLAPVLEGDRSVVRLRLEGPARFLRLRAPR